MTALKSLIAASTVVLALGTGSAFAAGATTPAAAPAGEMTAPAVKAKPVRSAASQACSSQADQQNLHGKARKQFRKDCMAKAKGTGTTMQ